MLSVSISLNYMYFVHVKTEFNAGDGNGTLWLVRALQSFST